MRFYAPLLPCAPSERSTTANRDFNLEHHYPTFPLRDALTDWRNSHLGRTHLRRSTTEGSRSPAGFARQNRQKLESQNRIQEGDTLSPWPARLCDRPHRPALARRIRFAEQHAVADESRRKGEGPLGTRRFQLLHLPFTIIQSEILRSASQDFEVDLSLVPFVPRTPRPCPCRISLSSEPQEKVI